MTEPKWTWEAPDALGARGAELVAAQLRTRERAAGYAHIDRIAIEGSITAPRSPRRRRRSRAALIGAIVGAIIGGAAWYGAYGAEPISGVASVTDGDTIRVGSTKVRLWGIDAPERAQFCVGTLGSYPCGAAATEAMRHMIERDPHVSCQPKDTDRYGRTVAVCWNSEGNLGARMVALGWSIDVPRYSGGAYRDQQDAAKSNRIGLWAGTFEEPAQWRKEHAR